MNKKWMVITLLSLGITLQAGDYSDTSFHNIDDPILKIILGSCSDINNYKLPQIEPSISTLSSRASQKRKATDLDNSVVLPQTTLPSITTATLSTNTQFSKKKEKTHTGNKPHQCTYCNKRFPKLSNLKTHIRTHTGEKPYKCITCNMLFDRKGNLTVHERTHTGDKPYECTSCEINFSTSSSCKRHTKSKIHLDAVAAALTLTQEGLLGTVLPQDAVATQIQQNQGIQSNTRSSTNSNTESLLRIVNNPVTNNNQSADPYASLDLDIDPSDIASSSSTPDQLPLPSNESHPDYEQYYEDTEESRSRHGEKRKRSPVSDTSQLDTTALIAASTNLDAALSSEDKTTYDPENKKYNIEKYFECVKDDDNKKTFFCKLNCGMRFIKESYALRHLNTKSHFYCKAFKCSECTDTFTTKHNSERHRGIHTGKHPFSCNGCKETFTRKSSLSRHVRKFHS